MYYPLFAYLKKKTNWNPGYFRLNVQENLCKYVFDLCLLLYLFSYGNKNENRIKQYQVER